MVTTGPDIGRINGTPSVGVTGITIRIDACKDDKQAQAGQEGT